MITPPQHRTVEFVDGPAAGISQRIASPLPDIYPYADPPPVDLDMDGDWTFAVSTMPPPRIVNYYLRKRVGRGEMSEWVYSIHQGE